MRILRYAGEKRCTLIKFLKKNLQRALLTVIKKHIVYTGTKLLSQLKNIKNPESFEERYDMLYHVFCSAKNCNENCIGETA